MTGPWCYPNQAFLAEVGEGLSPKLRGKRFAGREEKKTYIRKYEKYYKQIIFLKKSLLRCTCAASVQPYFFPPILSPEYLGQYKCGKWQMGHHDDHAFLRSCPSILLRFLSYSFQKHAVLLK